MGPHSIVNRIRFAFGRRTGDSGIRVASGRTPAKKPIMFALYLARGLPVGVGVGPTRQSEDTKMTYVVPLLCKSEGRDSLHSLERILDY